MADDRESDASTPDQTVQALYETLRAIAHDHMQHERSDHTLQATAIVHEAYLRIASVDQEVWQDEDHFMSIAAGTIRRVLVDHARGRDRVKRGGRDRPMPLHSGIEGVGGATVDVLALHDALDALERQDALGARLVELRFFAGLTLEQAAEATGIARSTASVRWRASRAWLQRELRDGNSIDGASS